MKLILSGTMERIIRRIRNPMSRIKRGTGMLRGTSIPILGMI